MKKTRSDLFLIHSVIVLKSYDLICIKTRHDPDEFIGFMVIIIELFKARVDRELFIFFKDG